MSLITELTLSFSDMEHESAPRKTRIMQTRQHQVATYQREGGITRLPQLVAPRISSTKRKNSTSDLGIKGIGKMHYSDNEIEAQNESRKLRKKKQKKSTRHMKRKGTFEVSHEKRDRASLPSIQSKSFTKLEKKESVEGSGKTMLELAEYFRSFHNTEKPYRGLQGHFFAENVPAAADILLSQVIEKDKSEQKRATRQLERSVLRGQGMKQSRHDAK